MSGVRERRERAHAREKGLMNEENEKKRKKKLNEKTEKNTPLKFLSSRKKTQQSSKNFVLLLLY